jgi:hypothetical protein
MRLILLTCEVMQREISYCVARSKNIVDVRFLPKGLHDIGQEKMSTTLQDEINQVPKGKYEAILLGYALCGNGIKDLTTKETTLVVPRAHDCITLLLGSKGNYNDYMAQNPRTYFRSTGWIERNAPEIGEDGRPKSIMTQLGFGRTFEEYVEKYGEDNARYIMEILDGTKHYDTIAYIDMGIGNFDRHEQEAKEEAKEKGWNFIKLHGDIGLLQRLVDSEWNPDEFLIVQPGQRIKPDYKHHNDIIRAD